MSRALDDLDPTFRFRVDTFLARTVEAKIAVMIVDTLRTPEEQAANLRNGVSWTKKSKHLPDAHGKAHAIDICPYGIYALHGPDRLAWDAADPVWDQLGELGERCGLGWGGRWAVRDVGHFEHKEFHP